MPTPAASTLPGALPLARRAPAPDVARGAALLLICLANVAFWRHGTPAGVRGPATAADASVPERVVVVVQTALVDGRAFPLFSLLLGYGAWQLARRGLVAGAAPAVVTALLRRRGLALLLLGAVHGLLLFSGDIAGTYGFVLLLAAGAAVTGRRALVVLVVAGLVLATALGALGGLPAGGLDAGVPSVTSSSAAVALLWRVPEWLAGTLLGPLAVLAPVAAGVLAARHGLLEEPHRHLRLLRTTAAVGLGTAVLGGLPLALDAAGAVQLPGAAPVGAAALHVLTGYAGGAGWAALAALAVARTTAAGAAPRPVPRALAALGRRSLSGYLAHSLVFALLLPAWSAGLGDGLGTVPAALLAAATWLLLLAGALALEAAGRRGPAEVLLRRLTHGRPGRRAPAPAEG